MDSQQDISGNQSIISHVSIGTNHYDRAVRFYESVLATLGIVKIMEYPGAAAFGKAYPEFWVQTPLNGEPASVGNGCHFSFLATNRQSVDLFHETAVKNGGVNDGNPGERPDYGHQYYGAFIRDPDGHKIEAMYWDKEQDKK